MDRIFLKTFFLKDEEAVNMSGIVSNELGFFDWFRYYLFDSWT
jgi:hypothetical protein